MELVMFYNMFVGRGSRIKYTWLKGIYKEYKALYIKLTQLRYSLALYISRE